jgi:hypothetical protein
MFGEDKLQLAIYNLQFQRLKGVNSKANAFVLPVLAPDMKHTNHFEYFRDFGIQRRIREYNIVMQEK